MCEIEIQKSNVIFSLFFLCISVIGTSFCQTAREVSVGLVSPLPAADHVTRTTVEVVVAGEAGEEDSALATNKHRDWIVHG